MSSAVGAASTRAGSEVTTVSARGLSHVATSDLAGHGDGMQVLRHGAALYVGHLGTSRMGTSILDVSDRANPRLVRQWPAPHNVHTHKVQIADGLLLVNHEAFPYGFDPPAGSFAPGLAIYDLADPFDPQQIGFWRCDGRGVHRMVFTGGRYVYLSMTPVGFTGRIFAILDIDDPGNPVEVGRWWWPGQRADTEPATWAADRRFAAHHGLIDGEVAYVGYGDANLVVLDVREPSRPELLGNLQWGGGETHTCLPLASRRLVVATDEQLKTSLDAPLRAIRVIDVADPTRPSLLAVCPEPPAELRGEGLRFGAHNLHENRPGSYQSDTLIFATYFSGGLRVYDLADAGNPVEVAHWVPRYRTTPGAQSNDLFVDADYTVYVTDRIGGGLSILAPTDELAELMTRRGTAVGDPNRRPEGTP